MGPKTFKASTAKQVLSQISRALGPDAMILSHRKIQDSEGKLWVEVTASPRTEEVPRASVFLTTKEAFAKFRSNKLFMPSLVLIAIIITGLLIWQLVPRNTSMNPLSQGFSVAVISFENQTGDNSYDYLNKVIPNLLITSLEQSGHFSVTSWERLRDLLKQMGKEKVEGIDKDLAFELCQMDDIDAIVMGSFAKTGDVFVTDVIVLDVETKRILKSANSKGNGEESIIQSQIDELSREISHGNAQPLRIMASIYFEMGKLEEALAKYKEASEFKPDDGTDWRVSYIHALKEDYTEAMKSIDLSINTASTISKGYFYFVKSFYQYWLGSLDESMSKLLRQIEYPDTTLSKRNKANSFWMIAWVSYDRGEFESCREHFKRWHDIYKRDVLPTAESVMRKIPWTAWYNFYLGLVDVKQGKINLAKSRLAEMNALLPDVAPGYKNWISFYHDFLQAEIFLAEGEVERAITLCEKSSPLGELVVPTLELFYNVPFHKDVLARAYRKNGEIDKAIAEYERLIVFDPQRKERYLIHPTYYYRLAELFEQKDVKRKAVVHYEKFLNLWQDADSDIFEVTEAKKRLSRLRSQP
jgi:tetratricopeptide (TPR) repeat protein